MSEAVRAAVAARRAAVTKSQKQTHSPSPGRDPRITIAQPPLTRALITSCRTGKLNLAARSPPLTEIPHDVWLMVDGPEPSWYTNANDGPDAQPWYTRIDVASLNASSNELAELDERIGLLRGLERLELHNNLISSLPLSVLGLEHLTIVNLSNNRLTAFPTALLALDHLHTLDLSGNQLTSLWSASDVLAARTEKKRLHQHLVEEYGPIDEDGIWTSLLSAPNSPIKRNAARLPPEAPLPPTSALHKLRVLKLARNHLTNQSMGLSPAKGQVASPASASSSAADEEPEEGTGLAFPPCLRLLDLSYNDLRAPLSVDAFVGLNQLQELHLDHTGMWDQVFAPPTMVQQHQNQPTEQRHAALPSLSLLTLDATDMNDLSPLESQFSSAPWITSTPSSPPQLNPSCYWLTPKQIVRMRGSERPPLNAPNGLLYVTLEGCPLVEENLKKRRTHQTSPVRSPSLASPVAAGAGKLHHSPIRHPATALRPPRKDRSSHDDFEPLGGTPRKVEPAVSPSTSTMNQLSGQFEQLGTPTRAARRSRALVQAADDWELLGNLTPSASHRARAPTPSIDDFGPLGGITPPPQRKAATTSAIGTTPILSKPSPASPSPFTKYLEPSKSSRGAPRKTTSHQLSDWDNPEDQAFLTEGQKRRLRAEAARKERERLATQGPSV